MAYSRIPLYQTIAEKFTRDIRSGRYTEGERLPPSRELARQLEVNRATLHQALQILKAGGWIETNQGGGTRVARRSAAGPVLGPAPAWDRIASSLLQRIVTEAPADSGPAPEVDLSRLAPDEREFPTEIFAALLAEVAQNEALLSYGSPFGYHPLRETLAERLSRRGVPADPDSILIVNGAQQGLDLITRALVDPGDPVGIEYPSYSGALTLLRTHRAKLLGIPLDEEGPSLEALSRVLAEKPKFLYLIPDFQNPTGLLVTQERRRKLLEASVQAGVLVVEDAFDADLAVEGDLPPPLAAFAPGHVIHIGTISKALFPGVRVGWISGPREFVHRLAALKRIGELTSPPLLQAALNLFLSRGEYDRHLDRTRLRIRTRLQAAHRAISEHFPVGTDCRRPRGGWVLWIQLPVGMSGKALAVASRERGVQVSAGAEFTPESADLSALRISVARGKTSEIVRALALVGESARILQRAGDRDRKSPRNHVEHEEALIQV